eukprot:1183623-Alexandrium_andersonii.AAC.1
MCSGRRLSVSPREGAGPGGLRPQEGRGVQGGVRQPRVRLDVGRGGGAGAVGVTASSRSRRRTRRSRAPFLTHAEARLGRFCAQEGSPRAT